VLDWPLEDVLRAAHARAVVAAREDFHVSLLVWASVAPWSKDAAPPDVPELLR
jgi:hypothetical protein